MSHTNVPNQAITRISPYKSQQGGVSPIQGYSVLWAGTGAEQGRSGAGGGA